MTSYQEKLKDPRWQRKRLEIMQRDGFKCRSCGCDDETLHVHHWRYAGEPWEGDDKDKTTVCETCHDRIHLENGIAKALDDFRSGISDTKKLVQQFRLIAKFLQRMTEGTNQNIEIYRQSETNR